MAQSNRQVHNDLKSAVNNRKYSDIEILCKDGEILYGNRAILATRSEVFDGLLYGGMKETYENKIIFPEFLSSVMLIILEYLYTKSIPEEKFNKDNILNAYIAADFFQLKDLREKIFNFIEKISELQFEYNYIPELFTEMVTKKVSYKNHLMDFLLKSMLKIPLTTITYDRLSLEALKYFLEITLKENHKYPLDLSEYNILIYAILSAAYRIYENAVDVICLYLSLIDKPESLKFYQEYPIYLDFIYYCEKVAVLLEPLLEFIDLWRIDGDILVNVIKPMKIIQTPKLMEAYEITIAYKDIKIPTRAYQVSFKWNDDLIKSMNLFSIRDNGRLLSFKGPLEHSQVNILTKEAIKYPGIYKWDIIIEEINSDVWIGVGEKGLDWVKNQVVGWVLSRNGSFIHNNIVVYKCGIEIRIGDIVTLTLNMINQRLGYEVNGNKIDFEWGDLPNILYPVVSCWKSCKLRIRSHT